MKLRVAVPIGLLAALISSVGSAEVQYDEAPVLESIPLIRVVEISTPREICSEEEIVVETRRQGEQSRTPVLVSTIIGGAIGNAVGHGKSNKRVGAVVGAMLGHTIGRDMIRDQLDSTTREYETIERCETVYENHSEERIVGYRVTYQYNDQQYTVQTDSDPGETIRVRVSVVPVL